MYVLYDCTVYVMYELYTVQTVQGWRDNACLLYSFEPWLDTSTLDPDTVRHHPTLRHQCQSTLDRHSARHSDTSV